MKVRDLYAVNSIAKSLPPEDGNTSVIQSTDQKPKPLPPIPEPEPDVETICRAWLRTTGLILNADTVRRHIETLKRWQSRLGGEK